ncbi:MAG: hypothetical protein K6E53_13745 [Lachnospiraceae bacterium]|nr:hypothetical protein [Lachnospiraceae bacterium]
MGMNKVSEDVMKRRSFISVVIVFIFSMTLLVGCGEWTQRFYSDKHLEKIAKKSLYEKYNEEFEVRNIYQQVWSEFYAVCAPVKDDTVVFEARLFKDGRIINDCYMDEEIEDEIRDEVSKCLDTLWDDYYIEGVASYIFKLTERKKDFSLKSYIDLTYEMADENMYDYLDTYSAIVIYLPLNEYNNTSPNDEYVIFANEVQALINECNIPPITVNIYLIPDDHLPYIEEYWKKNAVEDSYIRDMRGNKKYQFMYDKNKGKLMIDYNEYCRIRKEAIEK